MQRGFLVELAVAAVLVVVLLSVVLGHLLGVPVLLATVDSGSMEPTLSTGDGFVAIPATIAGSPGVGDVVVFRAEAVHAGQFTTHRIVDERPGGYVTQGDANPVTDQSSGEPLVTEGQITAVSLTIGGEVVRIPHLGTGGDAIGSALARAEGAVAGLLGVRGLGPDQLALLLFGLGTAAFAVSFLGERSTRRARSRERSRSATERFDVRWLLAGSVFLVCAGATVGMVVPAGTETIGIVSSEGDSANPTTVPVGGSDSYESARHNAGVLPTVSYFEPRSTGIDVSPARLELSRGETVNATVTLRAPDETGYFLRSYTEYRYFDVLPTPVLDGLYHAHPWVPYLVINALFGGTVLAAWTVFSGPTTIRLRNRKRARPT